jgi:hypothetical protein
VTRCPFLLLFLLATDGKSEVCREPHEKTVVKRGETFALGYSVLVHEGDTPAAQLAAEIREPAP